MHKTQHFDARMNQRGITKEMVDLALAWGEVDGERITLDQKSCREIGNALKMMAKKIDLLGQKGGVVLVQENDALITTYRANSFCASKAKKVRDNF